MRLYIFFNSENYLETFKDKYLIIILFFIYFYNNFIINLFEKFKI